MILGDTGAGFIVPTNDLLQHWQEVRDFREELRESINNLGYNKTQLTIASATVIFDADVVQETNHEHSTPD